jgi:alpha-D-xyloside xylohydrolase
MHGDRGPHDIPVLDDRDWGGGYLFTGQANELWSYGEEVFAILKKNLALRDTLKDYIADLFKQAHTDGSPLIRAMFYEFAEDPKCWEVYDQYMFGDQYLVAPILHPDTFERNVYLPSGRWMDIRDEKVYEGGMTISAKAPLDSIPVFRKV